MWAKTAGAKNRKSNQDLSIPNKLINTQNTMVFISFAGEGVEKEGTWPRLG